jgi:hypothetical protein
MLMTSVSVFCQKDGKHHPSTGHVKIIEKFHWHFKISYWSVYGLILWKIRFASVLCHPRESRVQDVGRVYLQGICTGLERY